MIIIASEIRNRQSSPGPLPYSDRSQSLEVSLERLEHRVLVKGSSPIAIEQATGPVLVVVRVAMPRPVVISVRPDEELRQRELVVVRVHVRGL